MRGIVSVTADADVVIARFHCLNKEAAPEELDIQYPAERIIRRKVSL